MTEPIDLRALRVNRGIGLAEAAQAMGVHRSILARAESRENVPHPRNAVKIAAFYGLVPTDLWPVAEPEQAAA